MTICLQEDTTLLGRARWGKQNVAYKDVCGVCVRISNFTCRPRSPLSPPEDQINKEWSGMENMQAKLNGTSNLDFACRFK